MKFNLKNRPKFWDKITPETDFEAHREQYITDVINWFEGFEKELREKLEALDRFYPDVDRYNIIDFIKEILGE